MEIVLLTHPPSLQSTSMPRFAKMLGDGMRKRGHKVQYWTSPSIFGKLPTNSFLIKKWLGYIDQFVLYPILLSRSVRNASKSTLYVLTDQALGMWLPTFADKPHVVHCNDFLAMRSARGEFRENPTSWTGRKYQSLIYKGLAKGRNFVSISAKTRSDLNTLIPTIEGVSEVVYLGLNFNFRPLTIQHATEQIEAVLQETDYAGFFLHVGGNQWYKNRIGVVELYKSWCTRTKSKILPLWMVGPKPTDALLQVASHLPKRAIVRFLTDFSDEDVCAAYNLSRLVLFPSLEEGFGWPILEAMACGASVLTTGSTPMSEVGGEAAYYLPRRHEEHSSQWAIDGAALMDAILNETSQEKTARKLTCIEHAKKFEVENTMSEYESIYQKVLNATKPD